MTTIHVDNLSKSFQALDVLKNVNLRVNDGEFIVIFGPNGCGKSTLLNCIAGLDEPSKGSVTIGGKPCKDAKVGFVFQNFQESVFPWLTVLDNVAFALQVQGVASEEARKNALKFIEDIGLKAFANEFPYRLSGGMKQLVSIARARAYDPDVFLLDEPFSALDYQNKIFAEEQLLKVWQESKKTTVFVSHDVEEAVFLADKVVVLSKRPSGVKKIIPIPLKRPRTIETRMRQEFFKLKNEVLAEFKKQLDSKITEKSVA